ncbi:MAG TPA: hypothetical protein VGX50_07060 [Longimicrobium sp.]|jgi:hypothetical protein|nr:hypothetical protein [Longimicrobium sp.]
MPAEGTPASIDDYIAGFPEDVQAVLRQLLATIREAAPDRRHARPCGRGEGKAEEVIPRSGCVGA